ncbi:hypothetical protein HDU79_007452 [Rhizoclosmatium sp. JEL0117]|nr:hypothetical protein HDU79_007452 [Rhizoclosmatium sp. JEL0117]
MKPTSLLLILLSAFLTSANKWGYGRDDVSRAISSDSASSGQSTRKLIVCIDGTSQTPGTVSDVTSQGGVRITAAMTPSNIVKLAHLAGQVGDIQKVYYHAGPGTELTNTTQSGLENAFGNIKGHVLDAYTWLAKEYQDGDEIFAFGFSRGATIVRSLFSLLREAGLPKYNSSARADEFTTLVNSAYAVYEARSPQRKNPPPPPPNPLNMHQNVTLKFIGVFDTVEALNVPDGAVSFLSSTWLTKIQESLGFIEVHDYHDLNIGTKVQHAYHALSMDEKRSFFPPTLFEAVGALPAGHVREQKWFRGDHADIGGGWWEQGLALVPLTWMTIKAREAGLVMPHPDAFDKAFTPFLLGVGKEALEARTSVVLHDYFVGKKDETMMGKKVLRDVKAFLNGLRDKYYSSSLHESVVAFKDRISPSGNM